MKPTLCSQVEPVVGVATPTIRGCVLCGRSVAVRGMDVLAPRPVVLCAYLNHPAVAGRHLDVERKLSRHSTADILT